MTMFREKVDFFILSLRLNRSVFLRSLIPCILHGLSAKQGPSLGTNSLQNLKHDGQAFFDNLVPWGYSNECLEELMVLLIPSPFHSHKLVSGASNEWMNYKEIHVKVVPGEGKVVFYGRKKSRYV